jgi:hypothetical protein
MGGHIHNRMITNKNIGYCGSLFQQNISESHLHHGYLLWIIVKDSLRQVKEIDVYNNYGFLKVNIINNEDKTVFPIPENILYYDIYYKNTTLDILKLYLKNYENLYKKRARSIINLNENSLIEKSNNNINYENITNVDYHIDIIKKILGENHIFINEIIQLHKEYYHSYNFVINKFKIKFISLEFENLYKFNKKCIIEFNKMNNKLCGIISDNNTGKTCIIDIILFALYDVHFRVGSKQSIINNNANDYYVKLIFEINNSTGVIEKTNKTCFFQYDNKNLTQKNLTHTLQLIKNIVGDYNISLYTSFLLQYKNNDFINLSSTLRKQKLTDILSLHFFTDIEDKIVKKISENNIIINNLSLLNKESTDVINKNITEIITKEIRYKINDNILNDVLNNYPTELVNIIKEKYSQYGISYLFSICKEQCNENNKNIQLLKEIALKLIENDYYRLSNDTKSDSTKLDSVKSDNYDYSNVYNSLFTYCQQITPIETYNELVNNQEVLKTYRQLIKSNNGIINYILSDLIPSIELNINNLLKFINLEIKINYEYEIFYKNNEDVKWNNVNIASGFQKFVINICFTLFLWKMSNVVIPDILIIDEGFGCCDNNNIKLVSEFLLYLVHYNEFDFPSIIFIISHINELNNIIEYPLYIENNVITMKQNVVKFDIKI